MVRGADFRFRLDRNIAEPASGPTQFGQAVDDWGDRFITQTAGHIRKLNQAESLDLCAQSMMNRERVGAHGEITRRLAANHTQPHRTQPANSGSQPHGLMESLLRDLSFRIAVNEFESVPHLAKG